MGDELAPKLNRAIWVNGCQMGNGVVLGRLDGGFSGEDGMVVCFNDLDVRLFTAEELLDGLRAFIVEDM